MPTMGNTEKIMKRILSVVAVLAAGATLFAAAPAMARVDVGVSIGVPGVYVPQPVYAPAPVYVQPRPFYAPPPRVVYAPQPYYAPQPVWVAPRPVGDWRAREWRERHRYAHGWGDRDHDGVPNRYDSRPHDPRRY